MTGVVEVFETTRSPAQRVVEPAHQMLPLRPPWPGQPRQPDDLCAAEAGATFHFTGYNQ